MLLNQILFYKKKFVCWTLNAIMWLFATNFIRVILIYLLYSYCIYCFIINSQVNHVTVNYICDVDSHCVSNTKLLNVCFLINQSIKSRFVKGAGAHPQNVLCRRHSHVLRSAPVRRGRLLLTVLHRWSPQHQGWGQFRNWNWNWYQFQFHELELKRNWIKGIGIGIGIDKEELKELIQFLFLIVNSFLFFAMFLAESLNQFDLKPFWIQLTRISLDRYIILYDNLSIKWILHCSYWLHL